ncbi:MAG: type II secretion system F family protein [Planctomycetales bacterium]|nr:type II secretion system F family protein [Planctomycetales bacterium]
MTEPPAGNHAAVSLDQLIALCEEMSALVRAGVPLERGLELFAAEQVGGLGKLARNIAQRLERGEPLAEAFALENQPLPEVYRAVIEAGIRGGHLAEALEGIARYARRVAELRSIVGLSILYPVIVLMFASGIFLFWGRRLVPSLALIDRLGAERGTFWQGLFGPNSAMAAAVLCNLVVLALAAWWILTRGESIWTRGRGGWLVIWLPYVGQAVRYGRLARFTDLLAILLENEVPLPTALRLASQGSGDTRLAREASELATRLESGGAAVSAPISHFPPLLSWLICARHTQPALVQGVRHLAESYIARAADGVARARIFVPIFFTLVFAGVAVFWLAFSFLGPWSWLLHQLAELN